MPLIKSPTVKYRRPYYFALALCLTLVLAISQPLKLWAVTDPLRLSRDFKPEISSQTALALNTEFDKVLYAKDADLRQALPAANRLVLALLAAERLKAEDKIVLSENSLAYTPQDQSALNWNISPDQPIYISNLLAAQVYDNSLLATVALAERLSPSLEQTVDLMNQRAEELGLTNTHFTNISGQIDWNQPAPEGQTYDLVKDSDKLAQYSSLNDLAKIIIQLEKNSQVARLFSEKEYFTDLTDNSTLAFHHPFSQIFSSEQGVKSAWTMAYDGLSFSFVSGKQNLNSYLVLISDVGQSSFASEISLLLKKIADYYRVSPIANQGQSYPAKDYTLEGDQIDLVFIKTINYIHPANNDFLESTVEYVSSGPHHRPLAQSSLVGQVIFKLTDGSQIAVEVGSDRTILSDNTYISNLVNNWQRNPGLARLIIFCLICLFLALAVQAYRRWRILRLQLKLDHLLSKARAMEKEAGYRHRKADKD